MVIVRAYCMASLALCPFRTLKLPFFCVCALSLLLLFSVLILLSLSICLVLAFSESGGLNGVWLLAGWLGSMKNKHVNCRFLNVWLQFLTQHGRTNPNLGEWEADYSIWQWMTRSNCRRLCGVGDNATPNFENTIYTATIFYSLEHERESHQLFMQRFF